jgi:hypothetical protein
MNQRWYSLGFVSLLLTLLLGILYRFQFAGISFSILNSINLHQAHTHMGFYGAMAALVFFVLSKNVTALDKAPHFWAYFFLLFGSFLGFLFDGYNIFTKIFSFLIYLYWLYFVYNFYKFMALETNSKKWMKISFYSLLIAALFLILIIYIARYESTNLINSIVKGFLLMLLLGFFTPIALRKLDYMPPPPWIWLTLTSLAAIGISFSILSVLNPLSLGTLGILVLVKQRKNFGKFNLSNWSHYLWLLQSLGMILYNLPILKKSHFVDIASLHFWILGPITTSFIEFQSVKIKNTYIITFLFFIYTLITIDPIFHRLLFWNPDLNHFIAACVGIALILILLVNLLLVSIEKESSVSKL